MRKTFDDLHVELFFPFPYKLKDPGTIWTSYSNTEKMPKILTEKLTLLQAPVMHLKIGMSFTQMPLLI
jgi:hypothetical protein